jgi:hypothetical protein
MKRWSESWRKWVHLVVSSHLVVSTGCGCLTSKKCCPVYLPHDYLLGSEAVRIPPCGPDEVFYGLKHTTWREWPAEWKLWQSPVDTPELVKPIPPVEPEPVTPVPRTELDGTSHPEAEAAPDEQPKAEPPASPEDAKLDPGLFDNVELQPPSDDRGTIEPFNPPPALPDDTMDQLEPLEDSGLLDEPLGGTEPIHEDSQLSESAAMQGPADVEGRQTEPLQRTELSLDERSGSDSSAGRQGRAERVEQSRRRRLDLIRQAKGIVDTRQTIVAVKEPPPWETDARQVSDAWWGQKAATGPNQPPPSPPSEASSWVTDRAEPQPTLPQSDPVIQLTPPPDDAPSRSANRRAPRPSKFRR